VGIEETVAIALNRVGDAGFSGDGGDRWGGIVDVEVGDRFVAQLLRVYSKCYLNNIRSFHHQASLRELIRHK
jgi:hypothetical protein